MKSIALAIYLLVGLLTGHYYIKSVSKKINAEIEKGDIEKDTEGIIDQVNQLSAMMGHRKFIATIYIIFSVAWLPAIIYVNFIKKKTE